MIRSKILENGLVILHEILIIGNYLGHTCSNGNFNRTLIGINVGYVLKCRLNVTKMTSKLINGTLFVG